MAAVTEKYRADLQGTRMTKLARTAKVAGTAEFFVMLVPGKSGAAAEGAKFVSGDEKLKVFLEALKTASYNLNFPDDVPTKVLRRGVLSCSDAASECTFLMMLPSDVRGVD